MPDPAIEVRELQRSFAGRPALRSISMRVGAGEMVALLGASGSGKSTLLRHLNGLQTADVGSESSVRIFGRSLQQAGRLAPEVRAIRAGIATIFQQFNLVDRLSVMDNVLAGALHRNRWWCGLLRRFPSAELARAELALSMVGIEALRWQRASTLSGGQQQRAAISRAVVQGARIVLADEPIASLDPESSRRVMELLADLNKRSGVTVVVSLHQVAAAFSYCPRTIALRAGAVVHDGPTRELTPSRLRELYGTQTDELFDPARAAPVPPSRAAIPLRALHAA